MAFIINPYRFASASVEFVEVDNSTGETIHTDGDYKYIQFTGDGEFEVTNAGNS